MKKRRKTTRKPKPRKPRAAKPKAAPKPRGPVMSTTRLLDDMRRRDLMRRLLALCQSRVHHIHSLGHTFAKIGRHCGLCKQRMREINKGVYLSEAMLVGLLNGKVVKPEDLFVSGLDDLQIKVLEIVLETHGFSPPEACRQQFQ